MITFVQPALLLSLLILPPLWILSLARRAAAKPHQRLSIWGSIAARTLAFSALACSLAGAQLKLPARDLTVIFLLDRSDSVSLVQRDRAERYLRQALALLPPDAHAGVVVFGQQALIARLPSQDRDLGALDAVPDGQRTNIGDAIQLALGLLPDIGQRRLVLVTDGGANIGDAQQAAQRAAARGVPLEIVPLYGTAEGLDAQISGLSLPPAAHKGQRLRLVVSTDSTAATPAQITVSDNGRPVLTQQVQLAAGPGRLVLELPEPQPSFNHYEVHLSAPGDVRLENDRAETYSVIGGQPRVLLVEGAQGEARNLRDALAAAGFRAETVASRSMPVTLAALSNFDAVVLVNMPLRDLPPAAAAVLPGYVRELGRGLAMIGGQQSFGAGGYRGSPIEAALPVAMDPRPNEQLPEVSVAVVIDISSSMSIAEGSVPKVRLAADGAARVAAQLRDGDEITVIPFDYAPLNTIGPLPGSRRDEAIARIAQITTHRSGITMYEALSEAARYLRSSSKPVRHLITITDGGDSKSQAGGRELVRQLRDERITVTSVAVGDGGDVPFLQDIAGLGGGRFFLAEHAADIPSIMLDESRIVLRPYLVERQFAASLGPAGAAQNGDGVLSGIDALPQLDGYVASTPKQRAQVLLQAPGDDPLLAVWQYGLGRSLAWTSDMKGQWAGDLVRWDHFPRLAAQMIGWLVPAPGSSRLELQASASGDRLLLSAQAHDDAGRPATGLQVDGELLAADGSVRRVALREMAPGRYSATTGDAPPGAYQVRLVATQTTGQPFAALDGGAVVPQGSEYRGGTVDYALLDALARITGGRINPAPAALYDRTIDYGSAPHDLAPLLLWVALGLLPIDIATRRLPLGR